jgi:hypothetical protein
VKVKLVTFKDIKRRISLQATTAAAQQQQFKMFDTCRDKPLWIWNIEEHKQEDIRTKGLQDSSNMLGMSQRDI